MVNFSIQLMSGPKKKGIKRCIPNIFFPEEGGFYEETWFDREAEHFDLIEVRGVKIAFLLCTEIWFTQYARKYGLAGADFLLCPRATGKSSLSQWLRCGQTSAVISGSYCLSSNRSGMGDANFEWGGTGWICSPITGELLATTSVENPYVTIDVDLEQSKFAKKEYPLYVRE